jgi:rubrerythrin
LRAASYIDEQGAVVAVDRYRPPAESSPPLQLPTSPERFRCLGCGRVFMAHPGPSIECPVCDHSYFEAADKN